MSQAGYLEIIEQCTKLFFKQAGTGAAIPRRGAPREATGMYNNGQQEIPKDIKGNPIPPIPKRDGANTSDFAKTVARVASFT